ncbi:MAG: hypothetical protein MH252_18435 [Thermosynechococcaceae cyanobacterium MS004]|nr:hypothetical protein [Thermosynechococcaceae cyanobacterium MS004]
MMTPIEINRIGYAALMDALGFDGMIRFLRQFEPGQGDYTTERRQWLDTVSLEDIFRDIETHRLS